MSLEAMKMALEEMEYARANRVPNMGAAIEALRQAIEQAEKQDDLTAAYMSGVYDGKKVKREWVGLTDEEAQQVYMGTEQMVFDSSAGNRSVTSDFPICIYRAIEAKLKEKNG